MNANNTFLAVFLGSKTNPRMTAWNALPEAERLAKQKEGIAAWKAWAEKHQSAIVGMGGPLGKTKKVSQRGIEDTSNEITVLLISLILFFIAGWHLPHAFITGLQIS